MEIEFGNFEKYIAERGFGFINRLLAEPQKKEVFVHIRTIKNSNQELAYKLNNDLDFCSEYFWYEIERTEKGDQVFSIVSQDNIKDKLSRNLPDFINRIESVFTNIDVALPGWVEIVAKDIADEDFVEKLKTKRGSLLAELKIQREIKRKEEEKKKKDAEDARNRLMAELARERKIEEEEFKLLVEEIKPLRFTHSKQVSSYIMRHRLGDKYKNISGVVKMEMEGNTWDFNGGFPPKIYAKLCEELDLSNQGTRARVVSFDSFKNLSGNR